MKNTNELPKIIINLAHLSSKQSFHEILAALFNFPSFYGMNWDAFEECLLESDLMMSPIKIEIQGLDILQKKIPDDVRNFKDILKDLKSNQSFIVEIIFR